MIETGPNPFPSEQTVGDASATWNSTSDVLRRTDAITANRSVTLPLAVSVPSGKRILYSDKATGGSSAFNCTFTAAGSDTVNGSANYVPFSGPGTVELESDGVSAWTPVHDSATITALRDSTDPSKSAIFDLSNIPTSTQETINVPGANSTLAQAKTSASNKFFTAMSAQGVFTDTQPAFSNLSGTWTLAQGDASTSTANKVLVSGSSAAPSWSTPTFPNASATNRKVMISDGTNWVASTATFAAPGTSGNAMVSDGTNWTSAKVSKLNAVSGTGSGVITVDSSGTVVSGSVAIANGSSNSGTPGTNIATITAAAGNQFICLDIYSGQANSANSQVTVTVTYSDSTTTSDTTGAGTTQQFFGNQAGLVRVTTTTAFSAKKITIVAITTAGTGTGQRSATVSAIEIPQ